VLCIDQQSGRMACTALLQFARFELVANLSLTRGGATGIVYGPRLLEVVRGVRHRDASGRLKSYALLA
jgi:hypothetical protein